MNFEAGLQLAAKHLSDLEDSQLAATILVDGRAGSGKTMFAKSLIENFFSTHKYTPKLVSMDDLYPGWEGLSAGSSYLLEKLLLPISQGREATWQLWDWERSVRGRDEIGNGIRTHSPGSPMIIEGCGSLSSLTAPLATLRIWIDSEREIRKKRFSERDAGAFDEFFGVWAYQEDEFYAEHKSELLADIRIQN